MVLRSLCTLLLVLLAPLASALYSASSPVLQLDDTSFKSEVLQHDGVVIVEFYAPWVRDESSVRLHAARNSQDAQADCGKAAVAFCCVVQCASSAFDPASTSHK